MAAVTFETRGGRLVASMTGEIDHHSAAPLRESIDRAYRPYHGAAQEGRGGRRPGQHLRLIAVLRTHRPYVGRHAGTQHQGGRS